jgi:7-cyano-7-deazaguanine reductase
MDDIIALADPKWIRVVGDFNVRGNIKTTITAVHAKDGVDTLNLGIAVP